MSSLKPIEKKYREVRSYINNGDIVLFHGKKLLAKTIQYFDDAYYNHTAIVSQDFNGRLWVVDSNANGVDGGLLSHRLKKYTDFAVIRPIGYTQGNIDLSLKLLLGEVDKGIRYDFSLLPRIAIYRKLGWDIKKLGRGNKDICSEFTGRRYMKYFRGNPYTKELTNQEWLTPEDHIRYISPKFKLLFNKDPYEYK